MGNKDEPLDRLSAIEIVRLINEQDRTVAESVAHQGDRIAAAIEAVSDRMRNGARMHYVGAGTSGRLAMLDAAELHPTFGIDPGLVQVIMAGGEEAFFGAVEGAEDDEEAAVAEVSRRVTPEDVLVGIAASGTTPFTVAAVRRANLIGCLTVGITMTRSSPLAREADLPIVAETGEEIIRGSTRMKSGTAQKLILNTLSTGVMIRLGKVYGNLMVEMPPTNEKLRQRAVSMVQTIAGVDRKTARTALDSGSWEVKTAALMAARHLSAEEARSVLQSRGGSLREALEN